MAADSMCIDGAEHDEVHKSGDASSGGADADAPAQESTACSMKQDDEEEEVFDDEEAVEDEADAEADVEEMGEAAVGVDGEEMDEATAQARQDLEPLADEEEDEEYEEEQEEEQEHQEDREEEEAKDDDWEEPVAPEALKGHEGDAQEDPELEADEAQMEADVEEEMDEEAEEEAQEEGLEEEAEEDEDVMEEEGEEEELGEEDMEEEDEEEDAAECEPDEVEEPQQEQQQQAQGKQANNGASESWPLPQLQAGAGRQWGRTKEAQEPRTAAGRVVQQQRAQAGDARRPAPKAASRASAGKGGSVAGGPVSQAASQAPQQEAPVSGSDRKAFKQLEAENRQLRLELGQATYKITKLAKLREESSEAQRRELLSRQNEARAVKELDIAKEYVNKRDSFSRNEKAELMKHIKSLEETAGTIDGREQNLQAELAESTMYRQEAADRVEEAERVTEKWRVEAIEQANKVKQMEVKLKQMEEKRQLDKARLRELASLLKAQQSGDAQIISNGVLASEIKMASTLEKVTQKSGSGNRSSSRGPSQSGQRKGGNSANNAGMSSYEDPIKPSKGSDGVIRHESESSPDNAGLQRQVAALWRCTLRPLLFGESWSLELEGGCSGAPGRGKGKKGSRGVSGAAALEVAEDAGKQNLVLASLVAVILGMAVVKLALA